MPKVNLKGVETRGQIFVGDIIHIEIATEEVLIIMLCRDRLNDAESKSYIAIELQEGYVCGFFDCEIIYASELLTEVCNNLDILKDEAKITQIFHYYNTTLTVERG